MRNKKPKSDRNPIRRGQAQLELVLILPSLVAMFLIILTVGSVGLSHATVAIEAHQLVWEQRLEIHEEPLGVPGTQRLAQVLKPDALKLADSGAIVEKAEVELLSFLPRLLDNLPPADHQMHGFSGSWDHRVIQFEDERDHRSLQLGSRVIPFDGLPQMRDAFGILAGMAGGGGNGVAAQTQAFNLIGPSQSTNDSGIQELARRIGNKSRELQRELGKDPKDYRKIDQLRREIAHLKRQRNDIEAANHNLNSAQQ